MDIISAIDNCIAVLGSLTIRVDQIHTVARPVADVIQALDAIKRAMISLDDEHAQEIAAKEGHDAANVLDKYAIVEDKLQHKER